MPSERHFAVRVDIKSLAANKDLPGHSLDYHDLKVEAPMLMEPSYGTHDDTPFSSRSWSLGLRQPW